MDPPTRVQFPPATPSFAGRTQVSEQVFEICDLGSSPRRPATDLQAISSAVERFPLEEDVGGSSPSSPAKKFHLTGYACKA